MIVAAIEGAMLTARVYRDRAPLLAAANEMKILIEGAVPPERLKAITADRRG
jgi:hypothetical protein